MNVEEERMDVDDGVTESCDQLADGMDVEEKCENVGVVMMDIDDVQDDSDVEMLDVSGEQARNNPSQLGMQYQNGGEPLVRMVNAAAETARSAAESMAAVADLISGSVVSPSETPRQGPNFSSKM
ncbi:hypothetical protein QAD02_013690 [Eretmocerus hayati]|uniref:Uncharacterized protein n=1 Tax=Eretmocerus hayati TaxID=131215 RepID=A0ACC2P363_9HYME|nr:hypothetical protein QAD02_013690 [Eretmocerus hayati]